MSFKRTFSLFAAALLATAAFYGHVAADVLNDPDLPTKGRSLFDHFVQENGGKVPYPFSALLDRLQALQGHGSMVGTYLPFGRSVTRSHTDYEFPRAVVVGQDWVPENVTHKPDYFSNFFPSNRVFIGYTEKLNQLEIRSWNERLGRWEFQVVKNYGPGMKPEVHYANRGFCISCHQNGGGLFPVSPWSEAAFDNPHVLEQMPSKDPYGLRTNSRSLYESGTSFQRKVDESNQLLKMTEIWARGCGTNPIEGAECRRLLLETALEHDWDPSKRTSQFEANFARLNLLFKKYWPKEGIAWNTPALPDRDPFKFPKKTGLPDVMDPISFRPQPKWAAPRKYKPVDGIWDATKDSAAWSVNDFVQEFLSEDELATLKKLTRGVFEKVRKAIQSPQMAELFDGQVLNKRDFFQVLLKEMNVPIPPPKFGIEAEKKMAPPKLATGNALEKLNAVGKNDLTLSHFKTYCARCHVGHGDPKLDFMEASSDQELWKNLMGNPTVRARLNLKAPKPFQMPPENSLEAKLISNDSKGESILREMFDVLTERRKQCVTDSLSEILR